MNSTQLRRNLAHADLRVLLMVLFHQTADRRWLESPYRPERDVRLIADENAGLPREVQTAIRDAAATILSVPNIPPAVTDPGNEQMVEMMSGGDELSASFLVSAIGQFGEPSIPRPVGAERFAGAIFHSTEWPADLSIDGRRVALIGTGATAMQIAPSIADRVASLDLYQRSPQWARPIPRYHDPISEEAQWLLESVPFYAKWFRFTMLWRLVDYWAMTHDARLNDYDCVS